MATTLFENGTVIDGTGGSRYEGHVLVEDDRITAVLNNSEDVPEADNIIDATGLAVAPGFIDMHSHADWVMPMANHPALLSCFLEQGVTTVITGNCGISAAPVRRETVHRLERLAAICIDEPLDYSWTTIAEFLERLEQTGPAVNVAQLVGHSAVRYVAGGTRRGDMPRAELEICLDEVRSALREGAVGLSFGLGYDPGMYSSLEELTAFCAVAAAADKPVAVHLKALSRISPCYPMTSLGAHNVRALREMLHVAEQTGVRLQLSHFIFVGRRSWRTATECLRLVAEARERGLDVMIDAFPYTFGNTTVNALLPYWFLADLPRVYDSKRARLRLQIEMALGLRLVGFSYPDFQVMNAAIDGKEDLNGRRIDEIAREWGTSPLDALLTLSKDSHGAATVLFHAYSGDERDESVIESVLRDENCLFETDAISRSSGYPNAAALGTFPKILGDFSRQRKLFSLEEAIRRMTSASAERFGLVDRGVLAEGKAADIVVFNPDTVIDSPSDGATPPGKPKGIEHVFINGQQVVRGGSYVNGVQAGRVLA